MNPFSDRRGMLMSSLMASLLVACGPEQAPAADVKASERSEVTTLAQALTGDVPVSLVNRGSGRCMDISGSNMKNGAALQLWDCVGTTNQKFTLRPDGAGYYSIVAQHSGHCLDVAAFNYQKGAALQQWVCLGGENQKFALVDLGTGYYNIRPKPSSGLVSLAYNYNWDNGAIILLGTSTTSTANEFRLAL
ncbi:MAG TPA: RICIN domain-containing protein [Myxococcaceae bacterium]|nr:RICIN domain-containing protein [Myxococcaceae bacterium]